MGKIVVLGATGTLGLPVCRHLKEKGYDVLAVGHSSSGSKLFNSLGIESTSCLLYTSQTMDISY